MKIMRYEVYHPSKKVVKESLMQKVGNLRSMLKIDSNNLVNYRLYITYTLADGFLLFYLDQSNICIEISKRLNP